MRENRKKYDLDISLFCLPFARTTVQWLDDMIVFDKIKKKKALEGKAVFSGKADDVLDLSPASIILYYYVIYIYVCINLRMYNKRYTAITGFHVLYLRCI